VATTLKFLIVVDDLPSSKVVDFDSSTSTSYYLNSTRNNTTID